MGLPGIVTRGAGGAGYGASTLPPDQGDPRSVTLSPASAP